MTAIPPKVEDVGVRILRLYEDRVAAEPPRAYLGGSIIGHHCHRYLWLRFRHALPFRVNGNIARLFQRGHREETWLVEDLRAIGLRVESIDHSTGAQFRFTACGGHVGGGMDGCVLGVPEAPKTWHVLEAKTHNDDSFQELVKVGLKVAKPIYFAQAQLYMRWSGMERTLHVNVNKNDDTFYVERLYYDADYAKRLEEKAERIVYASQPPERISKDPTWYQCRMCDLHGLCHGQRLPKAVCRTCMHATPEKDGTWSCARHMRTLPFQDQLKGCRDHVYIPAMMPPAWKAVDADAGNNWVRYEVDGVSVSNGTPSQTVSASSDLEGLDGPPHPAAAALAEFGAKVVVDDGSPRLSSSDVKQLMTWQQQFDATIGTKPTRSQR